MRNLMATSVATSVPAMPTRRNAGLQVRQLKKLRELRTENKRLKKLVTKLRLDKSILENVVRLSSACKLSS
jgi:hypothetical protein